MIPPCDHTGTPDIEFEGFAHFLSSTTSGSACLMSVRTRASVWPRQSLFEPLSFFPFFFVVVVAFFMVGHIVRAPLTPLIRKETYCHAARNLVRFSMPQINTFLTFKNQ